MFALSPVELGGLIEAVAERKPMKELFHDPGKGKPGYCLLHNAPLQSCTGLSQC